MKLLMEGWRKFLKENKAEEIEKRLKLLGLHMEQTNFGFNIALIDGVHEQSEKREAVVVGMIETVRSEEPCIPKTHEIGTVATDPSVRGTGIGTYLYEVAALVVHENLQGGITSDHQSSTTVPAADVWDRLQRSGLECCGVINWGAYHRAVSLAPLKSSRGAGAVVIGA